MFILYYSFMMNCIHTHCRFRGRIKVCPRHNLRSVRNQAQRQPKDPSEYSSIDKDGDNAQGGWIVSTLRWINKVAIGKPSTHSSSTNPLGNLLNKLLRDNALALRRRSPSKIPDYHQLKQLEDTTDPAVIQRLETLLLTSRQSVLKLLFCCPSIAVMDPTDVSIRIIALKTVLPCVDVARMVSLAPDRFFFSSSIEGGDNGEMSCWQQQMSVIVQASQLLYTGLEGADIDFLIQEDPEVLFIGVENIEIGVKELRKLWNVDSTALRNSDALELGLAVRALGPGGPPEWF